MQGIETTIAGEDELPERTCIVSRQQAEADELIRFVRAPDGMVVPDLKRRLPGRGAHVSINRHAVDEAVRRKLFARALRSEIKGPADLGAQVDALLVRNVQGFMSLARKAGQFVTGAAKVDGALRSGEAIALIEASDGAADGQRKMEAARRAGEAGSGRQISTYRLLSADELALALGGANVIHAAVLAGDAGATLVSRLRTLARYRETEPA